MRNSWQIIPQLNHRRRRAWGRVTSLFRLLPQTTEKVEYRGIIVSQPSQCCEILRHSICKYRIKNQNERVKYSLYFFTLMTDVDNTWQGSNMELKCFPKILIMVSCEYPGSLTCTNWYISGTRTTLIDLRKVIFSLNTHGWFRRWLWPKEKKTCAILWRLELCQIYNNIVWSFSRYSSLLHFLLHRRWRITFSSLKSFCHEIGQNTVNLTLHDLNQITIIFANPHKSLL